LISALAGANTHSAILPAIERAFDRACIDFRLINNQRRRSAITPHDVVVEPEQFEAQGRSLE
jgi:hypothetical protein